MTVAQGHAGETELTGVEPALASSHHLASGHVLRVPPVVAHRMVVAVGTGGDWSVDDDEVWRRPETAKTMATFRRAFLGVR